MCGCLTSINLPGSLTLIGEASFLNAVSLNGIAIPNKIETISKQAFKNCYMLELVDWSNNNKNIKTIEYTLSKISWIKT